MTTLESLLARIEEIEERQDAVDKRFRVIWLALRQGFLLAIGEIERVLKIKGKK